MGIEGAAAAATSVLLQRGSIILCSNRLDIISRRRKRTNHDHAFLSFHRQSLHTLPIRLFDTAFFASSNPKISLSLIARAAESTQPSSSAVVSDEEFSLAKVSFGVIGLGIGITLLSYGFGAYFNILPGSEWSALMLTYGFPLAIIGMALKYAELKPVPCLTYLDAQKLRARCATPILKQVRSDVIRYRYGDEQHLDEALKRIFQYGQVTLR